jgi:hypothetical protein
LSYEFIFQVGEIIGHDFYEDFPELKDIPKLKNKTTSPVEEAYIHLLKQYKSLLILVVKIIAECETLSLRKEIAKYLKSIQ